MFKQFVLSLAAVLALSACSTSPENEAQGPCDGVRVVVDFGILGEPKIDSCVAVEGEDILASTALSAAGIALEGTATYGDQIVCRVNDLPSATQPIEIEGQEPHLETCADMPPAFAYWALWVVNDEDIGWEYASEGASSLKLSKGQSIGLAFASGDEAPNPDN
jgi:hypothetical protein